MVSCVVSLAGPRSCRLWTRQSTQAPAKVTLTPTTTRHCDYAVLRWGMERLRLKPGPSLSRRVPEGGTGHAGELPGGGHG